MFRYSRERWAEIKAKKQALLEEERRLDEKLAQLTLYGDRHGHVTLTPLFPDEYGRMAGNQEWIEWDRITWGYGHSVRV